MKTNILKKKNYDSPKIECIELDNEISLTLASFNDPSEPGVSLQKTPEYFNNDPYKNGLA